MFAGGGEASVLSVQRRTNPKHAADYSRGVKMHNCERGGPFPRRKDLGRFTGNSVLNTITEKDSHLTRPGKMHRGSNHGDAAGH